MRRIKTRGKLKKDGLIINILKLEGCNAERNYMKHFNINANVNNNNNTNVSNNNVNNNTNDDDDKIRDKSSDIRTILSRLGNIVTKNDRKKIKKELYEIENKKNLSDKEKEKNYDNLVELANNLNKKEKYKYHDRDDLDYHGIRDIEEQKEWYICKIEFCDDNNNNEKRKFKLYKKVGDHCHFTRKFIAVAHSICNLNDKVPQEIPVKFHNGSKYDYHFIIKELAEEFKGEFECLGENTEKYISFSVPIKKEHNNGETITYKIKFVDTCRFMPSKLSNLVDNLSEINNKDCKTCMEKKY